MGKNHLLLIATHCPVKEVVLGLLPGTLLMSFICSGAIYLLHSHGRERSSHMVLENHGESRRGGRKKDKKVHRPYSEKYKDKFKNDLTKLFKLKRHHEPGFNIGSFSIEYDYPRYLVNFLSLEVEEYNFGILWNKERINSAIAIIESTEKKKLHIDQIAETVGFRSKGSLQRVLTT